MTDAAVNDCQAGIICAENAAPILEAKGVSRAFRVSQGFFREAALLTAVNAVSFKLHKGQSLGLVGESGCGKSTLGRLACGLMEPTAGAMELHGRPLPLAGAKSWAAGNIQMIFQDPAASLNPRMTALNSVAEPLLARGVKKRDARAEAGRLLSLVGLPDAGRRYPHQFSGGQRQRIAIARAIITKPDVIVCDEPVSALDASVQAQILNLLCDLRDQFAPAYLFISHDLAVIGFLCSRVLVMYLGQIVEDAPRGQLFDHAAHPYSRALLAAMPQTACGSASEQAVKILPGELPSPINPPSGCHFHPRCPMARPICAEQAPPWQIMAPHWRARCHFAGQGT